MKDEYSESLHKKLFQLVRKNVTKLTLKNNLRLVLLIKEINSRKIETSDEENCIGIVV